MRNAKLAVAVCVMTWMARRYIFNFFATPAFANSPAIGWKAADSILGRPLSKHHLPVVRE